MAAVVANATSPCPYPPTFYVRLISDKHIHFAPVSTLTGCLFRIWVVSLAYSMDCRFSASRAARAARFMGA